MRLLISALLQNQVKRQNNPPSWAHFHSQICRPVAMRAPPVIPPSTSTVSISIIHANAWAYKVPCAGLFKPTYPGLETFDLCSYSFLISHGQGEAKQNVLFDLGIRKDWENYPPQMVQKLIKWGTELKIGQQVSETLLENGFQPKDVSAIIWSHLHWDHTGNPATFPPSTKLIFGPGITEKFMPGWPTVPNAAFREADLAGRELQALEEADFDMDIGGFKAMDFFGDGSFYILNAPGHSIGHLNALARTTSNPDTFIFLAADSVHLGGEFRPTEGLPLPDRIDVPGIVPCPCAAEELLALHPLHSSTQPFLGLDPSFPDELKPAEHTIQLLQSFDIDERVFIIFSHDISIFEILKYFPEQANEWKAQGWKEKGRWTFLAGIQKAVAQA